MRSDGIKFKLRTLMVMAAGTVRAAATLNAKDTLVAAPARKVWLTHPNVVVTAGFGALEPAGVNMRALERR